jgi:class 3 adenylate cyclase
VTEQPPGREAGEADSRTPTSQDIDRLNVMLREMGATDEELAQAARTFGWGTVALDLALRDGQPALTLEEVAELIGATPTEVATFWQAFGLANPTGGPIRISRQLAEAQVVVSGSVREWLGDEAGLGIARVVGAAAARLAETVVDAFRMGFEVPELASGTSYADVVEGYVAMTKLSLEPFQALLIGVLKAHLVRVSAGAWAPDVEAAGARRDLVVGFVDLVGYTALSRTLSPRELASLVDRFEETLGDSLARHRGRLVKLIGDGAMFVADSVDGGCALALDMAESFPGQHALPPVRIGIAWGSVLSLYGDYYGDEVNLAARLVALARPGTVVVSERLSRQASVSWRFEPLPPAALKGFGAPESVFRLLGPGTR